MILFYRQNGQVIMLRQTLLPQIEVNKALSFVDVPYDPRMDGSHLMKYINGEVKYEKHPAVLEEERKEKAKQDFVKDMADIQKAKTVDELKPLLIKLLNK